MSEAQAINTVLEAVARSLENDLKYRRGPAHTMERLAFKHCIEVIESAKVKV